MQALTRAAERPARAAHMAPPPSSARRVTRARYSSEGATTNSPNSPNNSPGSRVEPWLSNPIDALAFAPRAALGALLTLPARLGALPGDLQRAQELLADPRPLQDKQALVAAEVEARLVQALEAGARAEQEALGAVKSALPPDAARAVDELLPRPPLGSGGGSGASSSPGAANNSYYSPDWMTSTDESSTPGWGGDTASASPAARPPPSRYEQMYGAANAARPAPTVTYTADAVAARQVASELAGVRQAVGGLKAALEALREGGSDAGSRAGVLRLNVREARDVLAARLGEVGPPAAAAGRGAGGGADAATLAAAVREARMLLSEVDGQFGF